MTEKEPRERMMVLPVPPISNHRLMFARNAKRLILSPEARKYQTEVGWLLKAEREPLMHGDLHMSIHWYRSKRQKAGGSDIDSRVKCLLDALQGHVYEDDSQIEMLTITRSDDDPDNPRVVVTVKKAVA